MKKSWISGNSIADNAIDIHDAGVATLGANLKANRKRRGMSQDQLAEASGVDQSTISAIETGETTEPRGDTLQKLADAMSTTIEALYDGPMTLRQPDAISRVGAGRLPIVNGAPSTYGESSTDQDYAPGFAYETADQGPWAPAGRAEGGHLH